MIKTYNAQMPTLEAQDDGRSPQKSLEVTVRIQEDVYHQSEAGERMTLQLLQLITGDLGENVTGRVQVYQRYPEGKGPQWISRSIGSYLSK